MGPGLVAAPVVRSARKAAGMPALAWRSPRRGVFYVGSRAPDGRCELIAQRRRSNGKVEAAARGPGRLRPWGALGCWPARPQGTGLQALRFSLPRAGPGERKATGAGARSAPPLPGGSGLDRPARQSAPIFVVVETIEHKMQAVFDRYLYRGARGPEPPVWPCVTGTILGTRGPRRLTGAPQVARIPERACSSVG